MRKSPRKTVLTITLFVILVFAILQPGKAQSNQGPFQAGERLNFQIKWSFIPAGTVTLEVAPPPQNIAGAARHFILKARTYPAIDLIYKFREQIDSYTSSQATRTVLYKKIQKGRTKRDITVNFAWDKHEARYTNFDDTREPISVPPGTLDPLSAFYFIRTQDLKVGQTLERPVTDGKKVVIGRLRVLKKETLKIQGHAVEAFKLEPELKDVKGVFEKSKHAKMYIWVTADSRKILVKIKSKVIVGSFVATLVNLEQLAGSAMIKQHPLD